MKYYLSAALGAIALSILLAPSSASAMTEQRCIDAFAGRTSYPDIDLRMHTPEVEIEYDNSLSKRQLTQFSKRHIRVGDNAHVNGLTRAHLIDGVRVAVQVLELPSGAHCAWPQRVEVILHYDSMIVSIASDHERGSCAYETTLDHEMIHVKINKESLREAIPRIERRLRSHIRRSFPKRIYASDPISRVVRELRGVLSSESRRMVQARDREHAELDSPESYRFWQNKCSEW